MSPEQQACCVTGWSCLWQEALCCPPDHEWTLPRVAGCESIRALFTASDSCLPGPQMFTARGRRSPWSFLFCGGARCLCAPGEPSTGLLSGALFCSGRALGLGRRVLCIVVSLVLFLTPALGSPFHRHSGHGSEADHDQCCRFDPCTGAAAVVSRRLKIEWPAPWAVQCW